MKASKMLLKAADSIVRGAAILFLVAAGLYSGYALWDNAQVYAAVDDIQSELLKLKPDAADDVIFTPQRWKTDSGGLTDYVKGNAMHVRTVLLAVMKPYSSGE